jgi:glycine/D-amino acid oxidase-like deaminating enzyme
MPQTADAVIVGGGVMGCSILYNLAKGGLARRMPAMSDCYFRGGWSGLFDVTPDWHPILDQVPGIEGLYCAVGFSGHGFKLSPMVGVAMAELITQGKPTSVDSPCGSIGSPGATSFPPGIATGSWPEPARWPD